MIVVTICFWVFGMYNRRKYTTHPFKFINKIYSQGEKNVHAKKGISLSYIINYL